MIEYYNEDCMIGMARYPDKYFDLAIVDPPYGGVTQGGYMTNNMGGGVAKNRNNYHLSLWQCGRPEPEYYGELCRVSKNQIIWGGNYFSDNLKPSQCWVVWDKEKPDGVGYADFEMAWTSFDVSAKMFRFAWNGMIQGNMANKEQKIHPTQKPVALYKWLLQNYAKPNDKILDTHVGSASSLIACYDMGFDAVGFELDADYYRMSKQRLEDFMRQPKITEITNQYEQIQLS